MNKPRTAQVLGLYATLSRWPFGKRLFSRIICFKAPYFSTIRPRFVELRPGYAEVTMRKRRAVQNHIGTVHAIAMANLCEIAAGTMTEATVPTTMRWIPKEMTIRYLAKAETDLRARCTIDALPDYPTSASVPVTVEVIDTSDTVVVSAVIAMWITARKPRD